VRPDPGLEVYGATKAALRNFARSWTVNSKAHDFRVNVLSPGPTKTPALLGLAPVDEQAALLDRFATAVPLGRIGHPDEIAAAATFLASDAAGYVNGAEWFIDGGYAQV
jgi:NAD(P)-dependent dehydrogenase (short-subunit alcohol dehydrogenase family)